LGSSHVITDARGALVELAEYTPYGSLSHHEGAVTVPHGFTGQRFDSSTGLYFYNARYYDASLGRFSSPDPFVQDPSDPQTLNRYAYVRNNPVNYVDPSGYSFWSKFFGIIIGVAVAVMTGNPDYGYAVYQAVDREISESQGAGEAITRTLTVLIAMGIAYGPIDSGLDPSESPKDRADRASRAGEFTHQILDVAYGTHQEQAAQAIAQDLGVSPGMATAVISRQLILPQPISHSPTIQIRDVPFTTFNHYLRGPMTDVQYLQQAIAGVDQGIGRMYGARKNYGYLETMIRLGSTFDKAGKPPEEILAGLFSSNSVIKRELVKQGRRDVMGSTESKLLQLNRRKVQLEEQLRVRLP